MSRKHYDLKQRINEDRKKIHEQKESWKLLKTDVHANVRNSTFRTRTVALLKLFLLIFIVLGVPVISYLLFRDSLLNKNYLLSIPYRLHEFRWIAFVPLILLQIMQIVVCFLPGQPIQFASSYIYGIMGGYIISIIGAVIGSIITYYLARFLGSESLHILFGEERVNAYVKKLNSTRAYTIIFLIYLIPGIPKDLVSYVAGISKIRLKPFIIMSTLGRTPGVIGSLLFGALWAKRNYLGLIILVIFSVIVLWFCIKRRELLMNIIESYEDDADKALSEEDHYGKKRKD